MMYVVICSYTVNVHKNWKSTTYVIGYYWL